MDSDREVDQFEKLAETQRMSSEPKSKEEAWLIETSPSAAAKDTNIVGISTKHSELNNVDIDKWISDEFTALFNT